MVEAAACKSCGAPIQWVFLNGKPHPVDLMTEKRLVALPLSQEGKLVVKQADTYISHFAKCPQAGDWRKR